MSSNLSVKIEGLDRIQKAFNKAPDIVQEEMNVAIKKSIFTLLNSSRRHAPVDRGFLRGAGMKTTLERLKGTLENVSPYAKFIHDGTKPHWPPLEAITGWANRHGIPPFLVARSIANKGTKGRPFFTEAIEESEREVNGYFKFALRLITKRIFP